MFAIPLPFSSTAPAWRRAARHLLAARVPPEQVSWEVLPPREEAYLPPLPMARFKVRVPERFLHLADSVTSHASEDRFTRLYRLAWRLKLTPGLLTEGKDSDVTALLVMEEEVRKSLRRLNRQLRLHDLGWRSGRRLYAGWCDVENDPVELALPVFRRKFSDLDWVVHTPARTVRNIAGHELAYEAPARPDLPKDTGQAEWQKWLWAQETRAHVMLALPAPLPALTHQVLNRKCSTSPSLTM